MMIVTKEKITDKKKPELSKKEFQQFKQEWDLYSSSYSDWRQDRSHPSDEPLPPILMTPGDYQHGFHAVVDDSTPNATEPHAIEREKAYRDGFLAGVHESSLESYDSARSETHGPGFPRWCVDWFGFLVELERQLSEARSLSRVYSRERIRITELDREEIELVKRHDFDRGKHQAAALTMQAVELAYDNGCDDDSAELAGAFASWNETVDQWRCEPITDPCDRFKCPPHPFESLPTSFRKATKLIESPSVNEEIPKGYDDVMASVVSELLEGDDFLSQVISHNLETSFKQQPAFALAGALALTASLIGRKVKDEFGTRPNIQAISVGPTTCGKDHARQLNKKILSLSGNGAIAGSEKVTSDAAIYRALQESPSMLAQYDEFGRFLKTTNSASSSPWLFNVVTAMMELYTSTSDIAYKPKDYADRRNNIEINQPCLVLHGTSTPDAIYEAFGASAVEDGFLGRCLIFESKLQPKRQMRPEKEIPESVIKTAEFWKDFTGFGKGNLAGTNPNPATVETTTEAAGIFESFYELSHLHTTAQQAGYPLWGRAEQKARQVALVLACGFNYEAPLIDARAARIACQLVGAITDHMVGIAANWLSSNEQEATTKRLLRVIQSRKGEWMTQTELTRKTQWTRKRERTEIVDTLQEAGQIEIAFEQGGTRLIYRST
ncbi:DUF3987 domain-containing protein [Rhodopirellula bahusiensis]